MVLPLNFWLLFGICMLVSAIGFKNYVWFISLGYGFSIAAEGVAMLILYGRNLTLGTVFVLRPVHHLRSASGRLSCHP